MVKVELFEHNDYKLLEHNINEWLAVHKDVVVMHSYLTSVYCTTKLLYTFYILYTTTELQDQEIKELAAEITPEQTVDIADINPQILAPTS